MWVQVSADQYSLPNHPSLLALFQKAHWIPDIEGEEDTSFFETREERYDHSTLQGEAKELEEEVGGAVFAAFNTCSPRYSATGFSR